MARGRSRPERRPGRQSRDPVVVGMPEYGDPRYGAGWPDGYGGYPDAYGDAYRGYGDGGPDDEGGSAPVREPRHPRPNGPLAEGGMKPLPEEFLVLTLPGLRG